MAQLRLDHIGTREDDLHKSRRDNSAQDLADGEENTLEPGDFADETHAQCHLPQQCQQEGKPEDSGSKRGLERKAMCTYSGVEQSTADTSKDGDIDGEGEPEGQGDVEQLGEINVAWVDVVAGVGGIRVGDLRSRESHKEKEERSHKLPRDLNGMEPKLLDEGVGWHVDMTVGCLFNGKDLVMDGEDWLSEGEESCREGDDGAGRMAVIS